MKTLTKCCAQCEKEVHAYELQCPYCGCEMHEEAPPPPLYPQEEELIQEELDPSFEEAQEEEWQEELPEEEALSNPLLTLLLLIPGSVFFLLGLSLFLFSKEGKLVFEFSAKYWFLYLLFSWPLLFWGIRSLKSIADEENRSIS